MTVVDSPRRADNHLSEPFPKEVEFVISALEAGHRPLVDRHKVKRSPYHVRAELKLFSDPAGQPPYLLFTRHISPKAVGFLCKTYLALSHGGVLRIPGPNGKVMEIYCTVLRCREAGPGWYEGAIYFNREQATFAAEHLASIGHAGHGRAA